MGGIGDHPGEAGGVEVAFFQVEFPGPDLPGEQPALEPVRKLADDALQVRELLVEVRAQPVQLVRLAELRRVDDLVVVRAVGVVLVAVGEVAPRPGAPGRLARGVGVLVSELQAAGVEAVRVAGVGLLLAGAVAHLGAFHALGGGVVGIAGLTFVECAGIALAFGFLVVGFVVLRIGLLVGEAERPQQLAQRLRVGTLVADATRERDEVRADGALELRAPVLQGPCGRRRRKLAEHRLARQKADHLGQRRLPGITGAVEIERCDPRFERRVEIDGDAGHRPGAEHLAPGLLQHVEHLAGLCAARHVPGVQRRVVVAQLQRRRVRLAAGAHDLLVRQRRIRALDPHRAPRRTRSFGHELDVELPGAPDRPRRRRRGPAERVEGFVRPARAVLQDRCHGAPPCITGSTARSRRKPPVPAAASGDVRGGSVASSRALRSG